MQSMTNVIFVKPGLKKSQGFKTSPGFVECAGLCQHVNISHMQACVLAPIHQRLDLAGTRDQGGELRDIRIAWEYSREPDGSVRPGSGSYARIGRLPGNNARR